MNKKNFYNFMSQIPENDEKVFQRLLLRIKANISMSKNYEKKMLEDFMDAIVYYYEQNKSADEIYEILNPEKLGDFYYREPDHWFPLDTAAKVYPLSMRHNLMAIFRVSAYMKEPVVPQVLQIALTYTIKRFPVFATTLKAGFFWYYLNGVKKRFKVSPESRRPCSVINLQGANSQSFRVVYYKNRISVECFHVLTDGTGALVFLHTLCAEYLRLMGEDIENGGQIFDISSQPDEEEWKNKFLDIPKIKAGNLSDKPAAHMAGKISSIVPERILHFDLESQQLKELAKKYNVTITALILAFIAQACDKCIKKRKNKIQIQVPANMRKYYPSKTLRNFSMFFNVRIELGQTDDFEALLENIKLQLKKGTKKVSLTKSIMKAISIVNGIKYIPLFIKRPVTKLIYGFLGDKVFTTTLSNIGVVNLTENMEKHIVGYDCILAASNKSRAGCGIVSYKDKSVLTITKNTKNPAFENAIYDLLIKHGLNVKVRANEQRS